MTSAGESTSRTGLLAAPSTALVVRLAFLAAAVLLLLGLALYGLAAAQLVWPELLAGTAEAGFGRVFPAGTNLLVFGWLTVALLGVAFHAVPRLTGARLAMPLAALGVVGLAAAGAAGGSLFILLGENAGGRWLEYPLFVDGALILGYLGAASILTMTARNGDTERVPIGAWYFIAASWWLLLSTAVGALPGFDHGLTAALQAAFTGSTVLGLWVATAAVGVGYHVVAATLPDAEFHPRLGRIGFWSLAFTWAWTAGRSLQYGPTNDWIETMPVLFLAGLVVAVVTIAADFAHALRGRWAEVSGDPAVRFVVAGLAFLVAAPAVAFVGSFRSVSAVVRFTQWEVAFEQMVILGAGSLLAMAGIVHVLGVLRGARWGRWPSRLALWPLVLGVGVAAVSRIAAGLQQGFAWATGVESAEYPNFGAAFGVSSEPLEGWHLVNVAGLGLAAIGSVWFVLLVGRYLAGRGDEASVVLSEPTETLPVARLIRGAVALFVAAALGALVLPAADSDAEPTLLADTTRSFDDGSLWDQGRQVYVAEGCWYCHTQQVRQVVTDVGLGPVSQPGDYAFDPAGITGQFRLGPDLAHAGSRTGTDSVAWISEHLVDPRADRSWSIMPSYRHLTDAELTALAAYLAGLG